MGGKVDPDIGLSYRSARLHWLAGRYDNPMPEITLSPSQGSMNSATVRQPYAGVNIISKSGTENLAPGKKILERTIFLGIHIFYVGNIKYKDEVDF